MVGKRENLSTCGGKKCKFTRIIKQEQEKRRSRFAAQQFFTGTIMGYKHVFLFFFKIKLLLIIFQVTINRVAVLPLWKLIGNTVRRQQQ